jgi:hypothetical protein
MLPSRIGARGLDATAESAGDNFINGNGTRRERHAHQIRHPMKIAIAA